MFDGNTLVIDTNDVYGDNRPATITASKSGSSPLTKQITVVDSTNAPTLTIEGSLTVYEGTSIIYEIKATYPDGHFETITNQYEFSSTIGVFSGNTLTVDTNNTPSDSRSATITAVKTGANPLTKQISIVDTTEVLGALVLDLFNNHPLNVIAYIENSEVTENHIAAYTGSNIIPASITASNAENALILASDFIDQTQLNWRFVFNIAKLVTEHPNTSDFTIYIKGRSSAAALLKGSYITKKYQAKMTLSGSPGTYAPSTIGANAGNTQTFDTHVVAGANGDFSESSLTNILKLVYNATNKTVTPTTY